MLVLICTRLTGLLESPSTGSGYCYCWWPGAGGQCFVRDMKLAWNYNNNPNLPLSDNKSQSTSRTGTGTGTCPAVAFYDNLSSQFSIRTSATNTSLYRGFKLERSGRRRLWRERARGKAWWILANKQSLAERVSKLGFIQLCPRIPPIVISLALSVGQ